MTEVDSKEEEKEASAANKKKASSSKKKKASSSETTKRRKSNHFQMFKAMEYQEEFQKVQLAGFLRDLTTMAKAKQTRELGRLVSQRISQRISSGDLSSSSSHHGSSRLSASDLQFTPAKDGNIHLDNVEMSLMPSDYAHAKIHALLNGNANDKKNILDSASLLRLCGAAVRICREEATVVNLEQFDTIHIVGDLHGSKNCLLQVLKIINCQELVENNTTRAIVFGGDYVDRGDHSLEVLTTILLLKLAHPRNVYVMRGNHEDTAIATTYGFRDELEEKYNDLDLCEKLWKEFGKVFGSLPIAAKMKTAAFMHGGIPKEDFTLEELQDIKSSTRCKCDSISEPYDEEEDLIKGILWSDPSPDGTMGMAPSPRGAGREFGPDVLFGFLDRHNVKYLIRAHEPVEEGHMFMDAVGDGRGCITVFSNANYPAGEGTNVASVLILNDQEGSYTTSDFEYQDGTVECELGSNRNLIELANTVAETENTAAEDDDEMPEYLQTLSSFVLQNQQKLSKKFKAVQDDNGLVTPAQWEEVMAKVTKLNKIPWLELQPELAAVDDDGMVDWKIFLDKYLHQQVASSMPQMEEIDEDHLEELHLQKDNVVAMFKLMDTDGNGTIDEAEFVHGMEEVNKKFLRGTKGKLKETDEEFLQAQKGKMEKKSKELFKAFDTDNSGSISIDEFADALTRSKILRDVTNSLSDKEIQKLQENHEMLLLAFKYLDTDRSGTIDREEFKKGVELMNKRLKSQLDAESLFDLLDADASGTLELSEFHEIFKSI